MRRQPSRGRPREARLPLTRAAGLGSIVGLLLMLLSSAAAWGSTSLDDAPVRQRSIVVIDEAASTTAPEALHRSLAAQVGATVLRSWSHALDGFLVELTPEQARRLAADPRVLSVEADRALADPGPSFGGFKADTPPNCEGSISRSLDLAPSPQPIACDDPDPRNVGRNCLDNWGLDRIDQQSADRDGFYDFDETGHSSGTTVHVYVVDSGITPRHHEFRDPTSSDPTATRIGVGFNSTSEWNEPPYDCLSNGHGTHVAGIIAGRTYGVAKQVVIHPVKWLGGCPRLPRFEGQAGGGGLTTDLLDALEWIVEQRQSGDPAHAGPAVVNLSGGNRTAWGSRTDLRTAVRKVLNEGISFVQAAGNQDEDACSWSFGQGTGLEEVIVVGALDSIAQGTAWNDGRWRVEGPSTTGDPSTDPYYAECAEYFTHDPNRDKSNLTCGSNFGSCVDLWAPGAHIVSATNADFMAETSVENADDRVHPTATAWTSAVCRQSGTSMAAPHVTGAIALYLVDHPTATPAQVKQALLDGAACGVLDDAAGSDYSIGAGSPNLLVQSRFDGTICPNVTATDDVVDLRLPIATQLDLPFAQLIANDSPSGLTVSLPGGAASATTLLGGTVQVISGGLRYQAPADAVPGDDRFTYVATGSETSDQATVTVRLLDDPPIAAIAPVTCTGLDCVFDPSPSNDGDHLDASGTPLPGGGLGNLVEATWSFGDGSSLTVPGAQTVAHAFPAGGTYTVLLTLTDARGGTGTTSVEVEVDAPPTAAFVATCDDLACTFDASGSSDDGGVVDYAWDFGDGVTADGPTAAIEHIYAVGGVYAVTLTVSDTAGQTAVSTRAVEADDLAMLLLLLLD